MVEVTPNGVALIHWKTKVPTPPAILYYGIYLPEQELDYPRYRFASKETTVEPSKSWKGVVEPVGHYIPIYETMGNHEALIDLFVIEPKIKIGNVGEQVEIIGIDKKGDKSAKAIFTKEFVKPKNSFPKPEHPKAPPYKEMSITLTMKTKDLFPLTPITTGVSILKIWYYRGVAGKGRNIEAQTEILLIPFGKL